MRFSKLTILHRISGTTSCQASWLCVVSGVAGGAVPFCWGRCRCCGTSQWPSRPASTRRCRTQSNRAIGLAGAWQKSRCVAGSGQLRDNDQPYHVAKLNLVITERRRLASCRVLPYLLIKWSYLNSFFAFYYLCMWWQGRQDGRWPAEDYHSAQQVARSVQACPKMVLFWWWSDTKHLEEPLFLSI